MRSKILLAVVIAALSACGSDDGTLPTVPSDVDADGLSDALLGSDAGTDAKIATGGTVGGWTNGTGGLTGAGGVTGGTGGGDPMGGSGGMVANGGAGGSVSMGGTGGQPPLGVPECDVNVRVGGFTAGFCSREYPPVSNIYKTKTDPTNRRKFLCAICRTNPPGGGPNEAIAGCFINYPEINNVVYCTADNTCNSECEYDVACTYTYSDPRRPAGASQMPNCSSAQ